jgi:outer membrane biosynthesis protein TonB
MLKHDQDFLESWELIKLHRLNFAFMKPEMRFGIGLLKNATLTYQINMLKARMQNTNAQVQPNSQSSTQPNSQPIAQPNSQPIAQPNNKPNSQPIAQPNNKSSSQSNNQPIAEQDEIERVLGAKY